MEVLLATRAPMTIVTHLFAMITQLNAPPVLGLLERFTGDVRLVAALLPVVDSLALPLTMAEDWLLEER